jgi:ferredoxin
MAYMITSDCINCNACEAECPNDAIYEPGTDWLYAGNTYSKDSAPEGMKQGFWSAEYFYVVPEKCTECKGFFDEPQCVAVCPVDCCVPDPNHAEDSAVLLRRKEFLDEVGR